MGHNLNAPCGMSNLAQLLDVEAQDGYKTAVAHPDSKNQVPEGRNRLFIFSQNAEFATERLGQTITPSDSERIVNEAKDTAEHLDKNVDLNLTLANFLLENSDPV